MHLFSVTAVRFQLLTAAVRSDFAFGLVRQLPLRSVLSQPQQFLALSQNLARQIIKCVHFMRARSLLPKSRLPQLPCQNPHTAGTKLDFDFFTHGCGVGTEGSPSIRGISATADFRSVFQITGSTLPTTKSQSRVPIQVTAAVIKKGQ